MREFGLEGCPVVFQLVGKEKHKERGKGAPLQSRPTVADASSDSTFETLED